MEQQRRRDSPRITGEIAEAGERIESQSAKVDLTNMIANGGTLVRCWFQYR
jgi:hypothetical protein